MDDREEREFEALVFAQTRFVFRVAYSVLRNPDDAEDVVQETFLKLYRNGAWKGMRDERAFLARAAWRIAVDRAKSRKPSEPIADAPSLAPDPEHVAVAASWNTTVARMLYALPEDLRQVLILSGIDGMNSREIALTLSIPEGTVRTRLMHARDMMKQRIAALEGARK